MRSAIHSWKKLYLIVILLVALIVLRDCFVSFAYRAEPFLKALYYNLRVWILWLFMLPGIVWIFQLTPISPLKRRISLLIVLAASSSVVHQLILHALLDTTITFFQIGWGTLMVGMFLTLLSAIQIEEEWRNTQIQASQIQKQIEMAQLIDVKMELEPDRLVRTIDEARKNVICDAEKADQILSDLADQLRISLKNFKDKLTPVDPSGVRDFTEKPRVIYWTFLTTATWLIVGMWMAGSRLLDDVYVLHRPLNWTGYWYSWLSWVGVSIMTPFIFLLSRKFTINRLNRFNIVIHFSGCIVFWLMINILFRSNAGDFQQRLASVPNLLGNGLAWGFKFDVYAAVLFAAIAFTNLERKKLEELRLAEIERMFVNAQLEALKMQLHPHFLFNSLNSIVELIHQDSSQAAELLERLKQFLRITLMIEGVQEVPLRKELAFVDCYLDMQRVRFPKRLFVTKEIDEGSMDSRVPVLILQPLIENAIRHGIAQNSNPGEISIYSKKINGTLHLRIRDTGPGITTTNIQEGIGLANTKRRLQHMYGNKFRFEIQNEAVGGLLVSLEIPCG